MSITFTAVAKNSGTAVTGISDATITIRDKWDNEKVTDATMTEMSDGFYKYEFTTGNPLTDYLIDVDLGTTITASAERYLFARHNGLQDTADKIARPSGGIRNDVKLSKKDFEKLAETFAETLGGITLEVDQTDLKKQIKEMNKAAKDSEKVIDSISKKAEKSFDDIKKSAKKSLEETAKEKSRQAEASEAVAEALRDFKTKMETDMVDFAKVIKAAQNLQKKNIDKHSEDMEAMAKVMKAALDIGEKRNSKLKQALKTLGE